jgi:rhamnosyl/mannosyltransferase
MRILHLYKAYPPAVGGMENHVRALSLAQARAGHQVTVLATDHETTGPVDGGAGAVRVVRVPRRLTLASVPLAPGFLLALARESPDITHLHAPYPMGELAQLLAGRARPYVVTYQADVVRPDQPALLALYRPLLRLVLRRARRVLATSSQYVASSPYLGRVRDRTVVVPLGVDTDRFGPGPRPPAGPPTVLFVGRMRHYKGVDALLHAMRAVPAPARLLLAGDGPMRAGWERLRDVLGLGDRVAFLGQVPDETLPALYRSADVFVLPSTSRAEAFGLVLLEAMASGLPCVTTEVGSGTSYVVQDGVTGLVVPPRDPAALAGALSRLVADPALRARMGDAGRARAVAEFPEARMVRRVEEVYRSALGPAPAA